MNHSKLSLLLLWTAPKPSLFPKSKSPPINSRIPLTDSNNLTLKLNYSKNRRKKYLLRKTKPKKCRFRQKLMKS